MCIYTCVYVCVCVCVRERERERERENKSVTWAERLFLIPFFCHLEINLMPSGLQLLMKHGHFIIGYDGLTEDTGITGRMPSGTDMMMWMFRSETKEDERLLQMIAISVGLFDVISTLSPRAFHHYYPALQIGGRRDANIAFSNSIRTRCPSSSSSYRSNWDIPTEYLKSGTILSVAQISGLFVTAIRHRSNLHYTGSYLCQYDYNAKINRLYQRSLTWDISVGLFRVGPRSLREPINSPLPSSN